MDEQPKEETTIIQEETIAETESIEQDEATIRKVSTKKRLNPALIFVLVQVVAIVVGIITSWLFWKYLLLLQPDVRISPWVLKGPHRTEPGKTVYRIRIVNGTNRQVIDLSPSVYIAKRVGPRTAIEQFLKLRIDGVAALSGRQTYGQDAWGLRPVFTFVIEHNDIESLLTEDRRLVFALSSRDALSGTTVVQTVAYTREDIKMGDFATGLEFKIEEVSDE